MYGPSYPAISILDLIGARSANLQPLNIDTGFWNLLAKPVGDSSATATPIILGFQPENSFVRLPAITPTPPSSCNHTDLEN